MHHGMAFNVGPAKVCSPAIFETCLRHVTKINGLLQLIIKCTFT